MYMQDNSCYNYDISQFLANKMARKRITKTDFEPTLSKIMLQANGDTDEFLQIVFDFLKKKKFAKMDNVKVKEKVNEALENSLLLHPTFVKNPPEDEPEPDVKLMTKEERTKYFIKKTFLGKGKWKNSKW